MIQFDDGLYHQPGNAFSFVLLILWLIPHYCVTQVWSFLQFRQRSLHYPNKKMNGIFFKLSFHLKFEHPIIQTIIFTLGHSFWGLYLTVNLPRECFWWVTHGTTGVPELREMALLVETWLKWSSNFDPYTLFIHVYTNMCIHVYSVHITSTNTAV